MKRTRCARRSSKPADVVVHRRVRRERQRVHGEVAPLGVALPVAPELHRRVAPEGLDVLAQGRHLERAALDHHRDGAVVEAGRHRLEAGRFGAARDFLRQRRRRHVDVAMRQTEQRVAHRAADHARFLAVASEHGQQVAERLFGEPGKVGRRADVHLVVPGTSLPFSMCAGM